MVPQVGNRGFRSWPSSRMTAVVPYVPDVTTVVTPGEPIPASTPARSATSATKFERTRLG